MPFRNYDELKIPKTYTNNTPTGTIMANSSSSLSLFPTSPRSIEVSTDSTISYGSADCSCGMTWSSNTIDLNTTTFQPYTDWVTEITTTYAKKSEEQTMKEEDKKKEEKKPEIDKKYIPKQIVFNPPATVVFWEDGTKTVVKCEKHQEFNPYFGFVSALAKKIFVTNSEVNRVVRKYSEPKKETKSVTNRQQKDQKTTKNAQNQPKNKQKEKQKVTNSKKPVTNRQQENKEKKK